MNIYMVVYFRNLVDVPHDNMLDLSEFTMAVCLIRHYLRGHKLPVELDENVRISPRSEVRLPTIKQMEFTAYKRLFRRIDIERKGFISGTS